MVILLLEANVKITHLVEWLLSLDTQTNDSDVILCGGWWKTSK